jgi:hypothetical protein
MASMDLDMPKHGIEVHSYINELASSFGTYLYGRRMYETMVYWETAHTLFQGHYSELN